MTFETFNCVSKLLVNTSPVMYSDTNKVIYNIRC